MVSHLGYQVVDNLSGGVEIRHYPEHQLVSVVVEAGLEEAGSIGFRPLVAYISGDNLAGQKIAMTAPVLQQPEDTRWHSISFVLPEGGSNWPQPANSRVTLRTVPDCLVAAVAFRGYWKEQAVSTHSRRLLESLVTSPYRPSGSVYYARYNPPSVPGIFRRNEALVRVEKVETSWHATAGVELQGRNNRHPYNERNRPPT